MKAIVNLSLYSKGHPPSSWRLPEWLRRAFTWRETKIGELHRVIGSTHGDEEIGDTGIYVRVDGDHVGIGNGHLSFWRQPVKIGEPLKVDFGVGGFTLRGSVERIT